MKIKNRKLQNQGMNWIRQDKRLAIYMRDNLCCVYCTFGIKNGIKLTLDHLIPYAKGGTNKETNLVTCCNICNNKKHDKSVNNFIKLLVNDVDKQKIIKIRIHNTKKKLLDISIARQLIKEKGSCFKAIQIN